MTTAGALGVVVALDCARTLDAARLLVWELTKRPATAADLRVIRRAAGALGGALHALSGVGRASA